MHTGVRLSFDCTHPSFSGAEFLDFRVLLRLFLVRIAPRHAAVYFALFLLSAPIQSVLVS